MQAAAKHGDRSEPLAALVVVARDLLEQYRAAEAERVRVARWRRRRRQWRPQSGWSWSRSWQHSR